MIALKLYVMSYLIIYKQLKIDVTFWKKLFQPNS